MNGWFKRRFPYTKVGWLTKFKKDALEAWLKKRSQEEEDTDFFE